jgi:hypothetical protein
VKKKIEFRSVGATKTRTDCPTRVIGSVPGFALRPGTLILFAARLRAGVDNANACQGRLPTLLPITIRS